MKTEEQTQTPTEEPLHFDAHEFDGLRDALEKEAQGAFGAFDQFIRENPLLCTGLAILGGIAVGAATQRVIRNQHRGVS
jgi:hypothetical protein